MQRPNEIPLEAQLLADAIKQLPPEQQAHIAQPLHELLSKLGRQKRIISLVHSTLGQLRVDMKYLVFDLESTQRERDEYKRQLEEKS